MHSRKFERELQMRYGYVDVEGNRGTDISVEETSWG